MKVKRFPAIVILVISALAPIVVPISAQAATNASVVPLSAQSCTAHVCMFLSTPSAGKVTVEGWPYDIGFYGHFQLTTPGANYNSPSGSWSQGLAGMYTFTNIPAIVGQYCIIGWSGTINEGRVCNSVL